MIQRSPTFPLVSSLVASLFFVAIGGPAFGTERPPVQAGRPPEDSTATIYRETWTIETRDGETGKPVAGITLSILPREKGGPQQTAYKATSDAAGVLRIVLPEPGWATIAVRDDQYFSGSIFWLVGDSPWEGLKTPQIPSTDDKPFVVKCWKGTEVRGRLVRPDGRPAAGVALNVGVYLNNGVWMKRFGYGLTRNSWDHGEWPNWTVSAITNEDGDFRIAVPPSTARNWVRIGTGPLGFSGIEDDALRKVDASHVLLEFAPLEAELPQDKEQDGTLDFGTLKLSRGVVVRGRVLDAGGKPLPGARLLTSGRHGPYAGRRTTADAKGNFEFGPMNPGDVTLNVDVRRQNSEGIKIDGDVRAVFAPMAVNVPESGGPVELEVKAEPHSVVEFEWIDRRLTPGSVGYYGSYRVSGRLPREGNPKGVYWSGETVKVTRGGRDYLVVKVPKNLVDPTLHLPSDKTATPSYQDSRGIQPRGSVDLGNLAKADLRVIYCDAPLPQ